MIERIGRYTIEELIGEGAFGKVFRARDQFGQRFAIKILVAKDDPDLLDRFKSEAALTAALSHKNIVTTHGFEEDGGICYLRMELLSGETLRKVIDRDAVTGFLEKVEIVHQAAEGLQYAHSNNVVHCDMKPENIMVLHDGTVKIMDFGIARVADQDGTARSTKDGFAGTIPYMAPEQLPTGDATRLSDIFSFGTIIYEFLSGIQPFKASEDRVVVHQVHTLRPEPLGERIPSLPTALSKLVERMMNKDPKFRKRDMRDVLSDLRLILEQLRRERAAELAAEIEPLQAANDPDALRRLVDSILYFDPRHPEANNVLRDLQDQEEEKNRRAEAASLVNEGRSRLAERRFAEAIYCFDRSLYYDQNDDIRALRDDAKQTLENSRKAAPLTAEARARQGRGELETALQKAESAEALDPGNPEPHDLAVELREAIRTRHNTRILDQVAQFLEREEFDRATSLLAELRGEEEKQRELGAQIEQARKEATQKAYAAALAAGMDHAAELRDAQKLEDAEHAALAVCAEFSKELGPQKLLSEIREMHATKKRQEAIAEIHKSATEFLESKQYEAACVMLREGLQRFGEDESIRALLTESETLARAQQRESAVAGAMSEARAKHDVGDLSGAIEILNAALVAIGEEAVLRSLLTDLEADQARRASESALAGMIKEARRLISAGAPQAALNKLQEVEPLWSDEQGWRNAIAEAGEAVRVEQRIVAHLRRIDDAIARESWESAFDYQRAAQGEFPNERRIAARAEPIKHERQKARWTRTERQIRAALNDGAMDSALKRLLVSSDADESALAELWRECQRLILADENKFPQYIRLIESLDQQARAGAHVSELLDALRSWPERDLEPERPALANEPDRVGFLDASVREAIEKGEWDRAAERLTEGKNGFPGEPVWEKRESELRTRYLEVYRKSAEQNILQALAQQDWSTAARTLGAARPHGSGKGKRHDRTQPFFLADAPLGLIQDDWLRLMAQLEQCILDDSSRPSALAILEVVAEDYPDFAELHSLLARIKNASNRRDTQAGIAQLEALIAIQRWADAEQYLADALRKWPDSNRFSELAARVEAHRAETELSTLEDSVRTLLNSRRLDEAGQLLAQVKPKYSQNIVWQLLRKALDHRTSYEAGLQQAEKALNNREVARAKSILKWLVKDAPDSRAKDLLQTAERATPRGTRRTR